MKLALVCLLLTTVAFLQMETPSSHRRRELIVASSFLGGLFGGEKPSIGASVANPTNQVIKTVDGIKQRRLGGSDIVVSELGLGTQRWVSTDFNAPDEAVCFQFLDKYVSGSSTIGFETSHLT